MASTLSVVDLASPSIYLTEVRSNFGLLMSYSQSGASAWHLLSLSLSLSVSLGPFDHDETEDGDKLSPLPTLRKAPDASRTPTAQFTLDGAATGAVAASPSADTGGGSGLYSLPDFEPPPFAMPIVVPRAKCLVTDRLGSCGFGGSGSGFFDPMPSPSMTRTLCVCRCS